MAKKIKPPVVKLEIGVDMQKIVDAVQGQAAQETAAAPPDFAAAIRAGKAAFEKGAKVGDPAACAKHPNGFFVSFTHKGLICASCVAEHAGK